MYDEQKRFIGIKLPDAGNVLMPGDLPDKLHYDLVFLNGCKSGSNVNAIPDLFARAFNANVYLGWEDEVSPLSALDAGDKLFDKLVAGTTIEEARQEAEKLGRTIQNDAVKLRLIGSSGGLKMLME